MGIEVDSDFDYTFDPVDPANRWLSVLLLIQQGVYAELGRKTKDFVDIYWYSLRLKTPYQRQYFLRKSIENLSPSEIWPFREVGESIIAAIGNAGTPTTTSSLLGEVKEFVDRDRKELLGMADKIVEMRWTLDSALSGEKIRVLSGERDREERVMEGQMGGELLPERPPEGDEVNELERNLYFQRKMGKGGGK